MPEALWCAHAQKIQYKHLWFCNTRQHLVGYKKKMCPACTTPNNTIWMHKVLTAEKLHTQNTHLIQQTQKLQSMSSEEPCSNWAIHWHFELNILSEQLGTFERCTEPISKLTDHHFRKKCRCNLPTVFSKQTTTGGYTWKECFRVAWNKKNLAVIFTSQQLQYFCGFCTWQLFSPQSL